MVPNDTYTADRVLPSPFIQKMVQPLHDYSTLSVSVPDHLVATDFATPRSIINVSRDEVIR